MVIAETMPREVEQQQIPWSRSGQETPHLVLDPPKGRMLVLKIDNPIFRNPRFSKMLDQFQVAAIRLGIRHPVPNLRVLPFEHSNGENPRSFGTPVKLGTKDADGKQTAERDRSQQCVPAGPSFQHILVLCDSDFNRVLIELRLTY